LSKYLHSAKEFLKNLLVRFVKEISMSSSDSASGLNVDPNQKVIHIPYKLRAGLSNSDLPKELRFDRRTERVLLCRNCGRILTLPRVSEHKYNVVDSCPACREHVSVLVISGEVHSGDGDAATIRARTEELFDTYEAGT
jgi:hypothetical protein